MSNSHLRSYKYSAPAYKYTGDTQYMPLTRSEISLDSSQVDLAVPRGGTSMMQNHSQDSNNSMSSSSDYSHALSPYAPPVANAFRNFDDQLLELGIVQENNRMGGDEEYLDEYDEAPRSNVQGYPSINYVSQIPGTYNNTSYGNSSYNTNNYDNVAAMAGTSYGNGSLSSDQVAPHEAASSVQEASEADYSEYLSKTRLAGRCAWPKCKSTGRFKRDADLIRHFEENHKPAKKLFYCDYSNCKRHTKPIRRKSHYKDHLRDYHREPLSTGRGEKRISPVEAPSVSTRWWRCSECLLRNNIERDGWECSNADCATPCEASRVGMIMGKMGAKHADCNLCGGTGRNNFDDRFSCSACQYTPER